MRMAELSRESGVPVATIKYYLREGLLPAGERTGRTQARYAEQHVRRLRLIRALLEVGGLSVAQVAEVLAAMDSGEDGPHKIFGAAQATVTQPGLPDDDQSDAARWARERVSALVEAREWLIEEHAPSARALARVLVSIRELEPALLEQLDARAALMERVAELDVDMVAARADLDEQVRVVVVGTVLGDAVMSSLRRMAQVDQSARRFEPGD